MPARKPRPADGKPQSERFIEMARELGCDEDEEAFKAKLGLVARHRPSPDLSHPRNATNDRRD